MILLFLCSLLTSVPAQVFQNALIKKPLPSLKVTAAYLSLSNNTEKPLILKSVTFNKAKTVEIHTHIEEEGMMMMRPLQSLTILPGKTHHFKAGEDHLMLIDLKEKLMAKETLLFHFKDLPAKKVVFSLF